MMAKDDFGFIPESKDDFGFMPEQSEAPKSNPRQGLKQLADLLGGAAQGGHELLNAPSNIANYAASKGLLPQSVAAKIPRQQNYDFAKMLGVNDPSMIDKALQFLPQMAPYIAGGEAAGLAKAPALVGRLSSGLSPGAGAAANLAGIMGKNALFGGGAAIATGNNPMTGATLGAAGGALGEGVNAGINKLRPSNLFAGGASPQQLQQNLQAAQGTQTPLGNVIQSPMLQRFYENILTKVPGSGANKKLQNVADTLSTQGKSILDSLLSGNQAGDVGETLQKSLKSRLATLEAEKRSNFAQPNKIADEAGLTIGRENFANAAKDELANLKASPELLRETDPKLLDDLSAYANSTEGNNLKLSNIFKGKINDKARDAFSENKAHEAGIYQNLKNALQQDVDSAIESFGNDSLKTAHENAMNFYREHIVPFEDPNILKFTKRGGDTDTLLSTFVRKGGTNDRGNLIKTLVDKLPDEHKLLPAYGYLSKALNEDGTLAPNVLARQWNNLGEKQKTALVPDESIRSRLDQHSKVVGMNTAAMQLMSNPLTGQRNLDVLLPAILGGAGLSAGGIPGMVAGAAGSAALSNPLTKLLTNENFRKALVQKMLQGQAAAKMPIGNKTLGALNGLANQ